MFLRVYDHDVLLSFHRAVVVKPLCTIGREIYIFIFDQRKQIILLCYLVHRVRG